MTHDFTKRSILLSLCAGAILALGALPASAQTRTWVSGVGNDANPCSRTAPCKTFAGAISKTAAGGEINCLDPGGFGTVTITKAITIQCIGVEAGVLASGGINGILIQAGANDQVNLVGLDFEGLNSGLDGIKVVSAGPVHIHNCNFRHFTSSGLHVLPNATGPAFVLVTDSIFDSNVVGIAASSSNAAAPAIVAVDHVTIMGPGAASGTGIAVDGTQGSLVLNNSTVVRNQTGLKETNSGKLFSYGNNRIFDNASNGAPNQPNLTFE